MACKTTILNANEHSKEKIILIVGTRPEGIKMVPLYKALKNAGFPALLCSTMQHNELLLQVFDIFNVTPDFNLNIMRHGQDLFYVTQAVLEKTKKIFMQVKPSLVIVQGDTTSTIAAALSAFYLQIDVAHVEAGLRTGDITQPFPEEVNRKMVSQIAKYHFTPTQIATNNLLQENIPKENIFLTGNTVVDALRIIKNNLDTKIIPHILPKTKHKLMLLTTHRRESFGGGIEKILKTVKNFLVQNKNIFCIYPFHPNPNVIKAIKKTDIGALDNIHLCEPISYDNMVWLLDRADLVLTDSGGIQEEAVALGKTVLILRKKTERMEGVHAGYAHIVGTDPEKIQKYLTKYTNSQNQNNKKNNIYGDGHACEKIIDILIQDKKNIIMEK